MAQGCVGLGGSQPIQIDAEISERRPKRLSPTQIAEDIGKKPANEELQRQIVDALAALRMAGAIDREPSMDNAVSNGQCSRDEPVSVSASLASTALLISSRWSFSAAAVAGRLEKSPPEL
jgi:hypothetical protein